MSLPTAIPCRHRSDWRRCVRCAPGMTPGMRLDALQVAARLAGGVLLAVAGIVLLASAGCGAPDLDWVADQAARDIGATAERKLAPPVPREPLRIMPAGDSITCGTDGLGGYRAPLFGALGDRAVSVGPRASASVCGGPGNHAGYPGIHTGNFAGYMSGWLTAARPGALLLMLGTNGDGGGAEYVRDLVRPALDSDPSLAVLVGAIPATPVQGDYPRMFNASVEAALRTVPEFGMRLWWVSETETAARTDQYGEDNFHPATAGYAAIADAWMVGLKHAGLVSP